MQTRLGARVYADAGNIAPFIEANWLHNAVDNSVKVNADKAEAKFGENVGEVKVGLSGDINDNVSVWGNVAGRAGSDDYRDYGVQLGAGIRW